ncbi:MAG: ABC transporter permease [Lachnospiraceae bacterium]|nr:ABC transporter permease [Lachnospiraceae bacterium]
MRQFAAYVLLQWKRCAKIFLRSILIFGGILLLVFLLLFGMKYYFEKNDISLVKVGIVIPKEEGMTKFATDYISSMDSVKSICSFEYMDLEEAKKEYKEGDLQAVIVLPEDFYHDVQVGINPPAVLYFPENPSFSGKIFKEMILSGVSFLQIAESSVYAAIDTAYTYGSQMEISDIGNQVALVYANKIFDREKMFEEKVVSPIGEIKMSQFYYLAGMVILLSFSGLLFACMYTVNNKAVDYKLKVNGLGIVKSFISKIIVMTPFIYIFGLILYLAGKIIFEKTKIPLLDNYTNYPLMLFLVSITLAIYFHILYSLSKDGKIGKVVIIIFNIIGALCGGLIIPSAYLSDWVEVISNIIPMKYWLMMLGGGM